MPNNLVRALSIIQEILTNIQSGRSDHNYALIAELDTIVKQIEREGEQ